MMSTQIFLVIGATGKTGQHTVRHLLEKGHSIRAMVHKEDGRSDALRGTGVEVVAGALMERGDEIRAAAGTSAAYSCYPVSPGLIQATAYFAEVAKRAALKVVVNMSQISAREDSESQGVRDHWIAERLFDWSPFRPPTSVRPSSRNGTCSRLYARPLSAMASSICRMATGAMLQSPGRTRRGLSRPSWRSRPLISARPISPADRLNWIRPESPRP
jgi:uncharacterized protein YbjT (DUF2867 family)